MRKVIHLTGLLLIGLLAAHPLAGMQIRVPEMYPRIQEAIDAASDGDTIRVAPGHYSPLTTGEIFPLRMRNHLVLLGSGAEVTILDADSTGAVMIGEGLTDTLTTIRDFTLTGGYTPGDGGGILLTKSVPLLAGLRVTGNFAEGFGGGIACLLGSHARIQECEIRANIAPWGGGGIAAISSSPRVDSCLVADNLASEGAGVRLSQSQAVLRGNVLSGNRALNSGGGILFDDASNGALEDGNEVARNVADKGGGIACNGASSPTIRGNTIRGNRARSDGGGIWAGNSSRPLIALNTIEADTAARSGGGILLVNRSHATIEDNSIRENRAGKTDDAPGFGGGINAYLESSPRVLRNTITGNLATYEGGGISVNFKGTPLIEENVIAGNTAGTSLSGGRGAGGGLFLHDCGAQVRNNEISGNAAWLNGGGIYIESIDSLNLANTIEGNRIIGNTSVASGAGIEVLSQDSSTIRQNEIADNISTGGGGGGIHCAIDSWTLIEENSIERNAAQGGGGGGIFVSNRSSPTIQRNVIQDNSADGYAGGGIDVILNSAPAIRENLVLRNRARYGGGLSLRDSSDARVERNLLANNEATSWGGGIQVVGRSSPLIIHNTLAGNTAPSGTAVSLLADVRPTIVNNIIASARLAGDALRCRQGAAPEIRFNDFWEGVLPPQGACAPDSTLNLFEDPLFLFPKAGDYSLLPGSPCIDAGDPQMPADPDGTRPDIGRYFFDQRPVGVPWRADPTQRSDHQELLLNFPNPFNPSTTILFRILPGERGEATVILYSARGEKVRVLWQGRAEAGTHRVTWDGRTDEGSLAPSGVYFCHLTLPHRSGSRKLLLLR